MDPIMKIAQKHHFPVIEDCCQAYFIPYKGKWVGTKGIEYAPGLCPVTEEELKSIGTLRIYETWNEKDIEDIAEAFRKVASGLTLFWSKLSPLHC